VKSTVQDFKTHRIAEAVGSTSHRNRFSANGAVAQLRPITARRHFDAQEVTPHAGLG
jgi:hypothetical protein